MEALKKIALKGVLLLVGLVVLNFIYKATFWQTDLEKYSGLTDELQATSTADILYLGDCSDSYFGPGNNLEKGISQLLDSLLPTKKVAAISETSFHAGMFESILNNIPSNSKIKTVIVTMNLRSFSAKVLHTFPNNSINQRIIMLDNKSPSLLNRFFLITKKANTYNGDQLEASRMQQWKNDKLNNAPFNTLYNWKTAYKDGKYIQFDENWTTLLKEKGTAYIENYAFEINTETNPRIHDFDNIVAVAKKRNWKLVFHLLPENTKTANNIVGKELTSLINYNRKLLKQRYGKNNIMLIDNLELLNTNEFMEDKPNSHYRYKGRKLMAKKIKEELINFKR